MACSCWCSDKSYASLLFPDRNTVRIPRLNPCLCKHTTGFSEELPYVALKTVSSCLFLSLLFCLLKVYFPNYHWKQKEFKMGPKQTYLLFFPPIEYLLTHSDWGPDAERWFMIGIALNVLSCSHLIPCDCASKKWSISIVLGRSGPKQRLSENFLNYSAPIITVWILVLKELSHPSQFNCPLDKPKNGILTLFPCSNKTTKITVSIYEHMHSLRECAQETQTLDKGTILVNFP